MKNFIILVVTQILIWGMAAIAISWRLQGSGMFPKIVMILVVGALFSTLVTVGHFTASRKRRASNRKK